ncbi:MAG: methyltransferase [Arcicella sp.]|nr:methyltransferase [Arcicella sp.]
MPSNTHFSFKKFTIHQDQTAMKVTTDACILGAYTDVKNAKRILDIGTGTGLLTLMLAQRSEAQIEGVEIEKVSYNQAVENVKNSIFKDKIELYHSGIQSFTSKKCYDLIISNPPFFQNHLKAENQNRNNALHTDTLSFEDLLNSVIKLLSSNGTFVVLLPTYESTVLEQIANNLGLFANKKLYIHHREGSKILRIITTFGFVKTETVFENLIIKSSDENYTSDFQKLLQDYYLIF